MKKTTLSLLLLLLSLTAFSQQEASVWYFGDHAGLKFENNGTVTPLSNGQLKTDEGCSSIADSNGNLLFYTDGRTVWDKNHIIMPNGDYFGGTGLLGDPSSTQSGIIVPKPGAPDVFYIFTVDEPHHENAAVYPNAFVGTYVEPNGGPTIQADDGLNNGLNYSIVDLSVTGSNNSVGNIIQRNTPLITYNTDPNGEEIKYKCSEKITAVRSDADNSYWVISHFIDKFYAFKVGSDGVASQPIVSTVGTEIQLAGYRRNSIGYLKASPDGTRLAIAHSQNANQPGTNSLDTGSIQIFDFDVTTGTVSNPVILQNNVQGYGVEFSPSSEKLYATYRAGSNWFMELTQFDLLSPNPAASKVVIYNQFSFLYALQLAPNNKIYCATNQDFLGVVNNPNESGFACNYVQSGQILAAGKTATIGLPPFITSFFNTAITIENNCEGQASNFFLNSNQTITTALWDFGDGQTSSSITPSHTYTSAGSFYVTVVATSATATITKNRTITITALPVANIIPDKKICSDFAQHYDLSENNAIVLGAQSSTAYGVRYYASADNASTNSSPLATLYEVPLGISTIFAKVYNTNNPDCYAISDFTISSFLKPQAHHINDDYKCDDASNDGFEVFHMADYDTALLGPQNSTNYTVSYHLTQDEADLNTASLVADFKIYRVRN